MPLSEARVSVEDRGFQFADGVYEVVRLYSGRLFTLDEHMARLERSAAGIQLSLPMTRDALAGEITKFSAGLGPEGSACGEGMIYLQLTRGISPRNHLFPHLTGQEKVEPTLLFYFRPLPTLPPVGSVPGVKLHAVPDERWQKCWIKSIALLPNVMAKSAAAAAGADEAIFIDNGNVTECAASNIFAVIGGELVTHPVGSKVLGGVTREVLLKITADSKLAVRERPWTEPEALAADELFITSTTREISWVSHWNGQPVPPGRPGPITQQLHTALKQYIRSAIGEA